MWQTDGQTDRKDMAVRSPQYQFEDKGRQSYKNKLWVKNQLNFLNLQFLKVSDGCDIFELDKKMLKKMKTEESYKKKWNVEKKKTKYVIEKKRKLKQMKFQSVENLFLLKSIFTKKSSIIKR